MTRTAAANPPPSDSKRGRTPRTVKGRALTDFPRIKPEGLSDRDLMLATLKGVEATHACLDDFRAEQAEINRHAKEARHTQGRELMNLRGDIVGVQQSVAEVRAEVGDVKATQQIAEGTVSGLARAFGLMKSEPGEKAPKVRGVAGWSGWTMVGASGGILVIYKVAEPLLEPIVRAMHHAIMAVH